MLTNKSTLASVITLKQLTELSRLLMKERIDIRTIIMLISEYSTEPDGLERTTEQLLLFLLFPLSDIDPYFEVDQTTAFFWLVKSKEGRVLLKELLSDASFKEKLVTHSHFLPALLAAKSTGPDKELSALLILIFTSEGSALLKDLLSHPSFIINDRLIPKFVSTLMLKVTIPTMSTLFWLLIKSDGRTTFKKLLSDDAFRSELLRNPEFFQAFVAIIDAGKLKNTSALFWLTVDSQGLQILQTWLSEPSVLDMLTTRDNIEPFFTALLTEYPKDQTTAFYRLLETPTGRELVHKLLSNPHTKTRLFQHFNLADRAAELDWIVQSAAGFALFNFLMQHQRTDLLQGNPVQLLRHPDVQIFIRMGILDPNLFLLLAAVDVNDEVFMTCLQDPCCSPWATTEKGYSLSDIINTSSLDVASKERRNNQLAIAVARYASRISGSNFITDLHDLDIKQHLSDEQSSIAPELPTLATVAVQTIEGVDDSVIQSFHQHIQWILTEPKLSAYHQAFTVLAGNTLIRNAKDYPEMLDQLKVLCAQMNEYLQQQRPIPKPYEEWARSLGLCRNAVTITFGEMFIEFSNQTGWLKYFQDMETEANAFFCRLLAIPRHVEVHLPKSAIKSEMGLLSTLPRYDGYLRNLNGVQRRWIAQYAMQMLIDKEKLIQSLVEPLTFSLPSPVSYELLVEKYREYQHSPLFKDNMSLTAFFGFVTGLLEEAIAEQFTTGYLIRPNLQPLLRKRADDFIDSQSLFINQAKVEAERGLLWHFLTSPNLQSLTEEEQRKIHDFLNRCSIASDGLAFIKDCIELHQADIQQINLDSLFYQDPDGRSIFSQLIANPAFAEWLFGYHIIVIQPDNETPNIRFEAIDTPIKSLAQALLVSEKTPLLLESALHKSGTLFFWLYYFQGDEQRRQLFKTIVNFMLCSPKGLYTYDALGPLLYDMQMQRKISDVDKVLVQTFLTARIEEQIAMRDETCWDTACLLISKPPAEHPILSSLRSNPWMLKSLEKPKHWEIFTWLAHHQQPVIEEIKRLQRPYMVGASTNTLFAPSSTEHSKSHTNQMRNPGA